MTPGTVVRRRPTSFPRDRGVELGRKRGVGIEGGEGRVAIKWRQGEGNGLRADGAESVHVGVTTAAAVSARN
jgi:hypothetical protein